MSESISSEEDKDHSTSVPAAKKGGKKKIILLLGCLALVGGGGYVAWSKKLIPIAALQKGSVKEEKSAQSILTPPIVLSIPSATANLDNGNGKVVYVKMTASVEISGATNSPEIQARVPEIQDIFQTYLHETRPQDLRGNGFYRLRESLLRRLRADMSPLNVTNLYITEFLTQ